MKKLLVGLLVVLELAVVAAVGYVVYRRFQPVAPVPAPSPSRTPQPVAADQLPAWLRVPDALTPAETETEPPPELLLEDELGRMRLRPVGALAELAALPAEKISISNAAFLIARLEYPELELAENEAMIDELARRCALRLSTRQTLDERARTIVRFLYETLQFRHQADQPRLDQLLQGQAGDDLALTGLLLALGQRLGLPWRAVHTPTGLWLHLAVRDKEWFIETATGSFYEEPNALMALRITRAAARQLNYLREIDSRGVVAELYARLAADWVRRGRRTEALELTAAGLQFDGKHRALSVIRAELVLETQPAAAAGLLEAVTATDPANLQAWLLLGKAKRAQGRVEEALAALLKATASGDDPAAWAERAACRMELKQFALAVADYQHALALLPDDPTVQRGLAAAYTEWGISLNRERKFDEAINAYTLAIRTDARTLNAYLNRARAYLTRGQRDLARADLQAALALDPNHREARELLQRVPPGPAPQPGTR